MQYQNITTLQNTNPKTPKWLFLMPVTLKLTNLLCLAHSARRTGHVPPNYLTRSLCAAPRVELGITKWRRNFEAFHASALRTSLPVNLSSSPCGKAKQRNSCFQAFPLGSSRKTAQLLFSRKMGFPKDRLAVAALLFSRQNALSFVTNVRTWTT